MSIATGRGDEGRTSLPGGRRVSKTDPRVEYCGAIDELVSHIGFARSICENAEVKGWLKSIQRDLFQVGAAIGVGQTPGKPAPEIGPEMVAALDEHVRRLEAAEGILNDWALPGAMPASAALDVARTVCRRAERVAVGVAEAGVLSNPPLLAYLNRLSDVLWLFARFLELLARADGSLRTKEGGSPP